MPLFQRGIGQSGHKIKIVSTNAVLSQMQQVKSGAQLADVGANRNYLGWATMDRMLRMILHKPAPVHETIPIRVFDATNIASIALTQSASVSGAWWGPTTYQQKFKTLWGLR